MSRSIPFSAKAVLLCGVPACFSLVSLLFILSGTGGLALAWSAGACGTAAAAGAYLALGPGKELRELEAGIGNAARGEADLVSRLPVRSLGEAGRTAREFNAFLAKLHNVVKRVKEVAERDAEGSLSLATEAEELSATMNEMAASLDSLEANGSRLRDDMALAERKLEAIRETAQESSTSVDAQSEALESSAAALSMMAAAALAMDAEMRQKRSAAETLERSAAESGKAIAAANSSLKDIVLAVEDVQRVSRVIEDITQRTNLLAMNAAIEASHAGDRGRGFRVVAGEIRKLAESTAANTKTIYSSLASAQAKAAEAATLALYSERAFASLGSGISSVASSMGEMAEGISRFVGEAGRLGDRVGSIREATSTLKEKAKAADDRAEEVSSLVAGAAGLSRSNADALAEMAAAAHQVNTSVAELSRLGSENADSVAALETEVGRFRTIDTSSLKASDGRPLVVWSADGKTIPPSPAKPQGYDEYDERRWYAYEYAGWGVEKLPQPQSRGDGPAGKHVACVLAGEHPYYDAFRRGAEKVAATFGVAVSFSHSDFDTDLEVERVREAVAGRPDFLAITAVSATGGSKAAEIAYRARVPLIYANTIPAPECFRYCLAWTGPDDLGPDEGPCPPFRQPPRREGRLRHCPARSRFERLLLEDLGLLDRVGQGRSLHEEAGG